MPRINVYRYDRRERTLDGWFEADSALEVAETTTFDGRNNISVHSLSEFHHQSLYRTKGGRWVLCTWSQWQNSEPRYEFVDGETARKWLTINGSDDVITRHFGEVEEERGPGRPEVGEAINVRLGDDLLARVDAEATRRGKTRAATLRDLVDAALATSEQTR